MLRAYCIRRVGEPDPPPDLAGVDGARVRSIIHGPLAVWVSESIEGPATLARLREHERVVRAALVTQTPLPIRFGGRLRSEKEAIELLESRREAFIASLDRLAGRVEFGLRFARVGAASPTDDEPAVRRHRARTVRPTRDPAAADRARSSQVSSLATTTAGPGRRYLERLRNVQSARLEAATEVADLLASLERDFAGLDIASARHEACEAPWIAGLAHLVHTDEIHAYASRLRDIRSRRAGLRIAASGPWAPYTFVEP